MVNLTGKRVYLDTSVAIYALEGLAEFANLRAGFMEPLDRGEFTMVTSELTLLECVVFPRRQGDAAAESAFRSFLSDGPTKIIVPLSKAVIERVIDLRARFPSLRTPDSLHIATGLEFACDAFLSGDLKWQHFGIPLVDPAEVG
jgi:predicted nucleic acid-binding protein